MNSITLARVIHVLAVVLWIGGVAMVTTVIIPAVKKMKSKKDKLTTFENIEGRFAIQAKITTLITAISGFYMMYELNAWERYLDYRFWWIHAMTIVWIIFTLVLYILEPLVLHKLFKKYANENPEKTFNILHKAHWILLIISLITILGAVAGSHGLFFIT
ncbi:hypothetical protein H0I29_09580 [Polaribacter sp. R2A056_3_33]|uniref:hypothetical protein n=1 Tax=unclassified Polaribacter TaxID=196858 RepID=UPI001C4FB317|nr:MULTISPECIES: hypothetical protein [unclassified Polaribacter]QXP64297.1 hypothetical protein H0I27_03655 [Polaribacter sp. HaHaR_3_91]QXP68900.1 hypothetical protein H0I29_09580 [Polaribacter sp. R2A056_3_33]